MMGENIIFRFPSGAAILADNQFIRGYCILRADPVVFDLNALDESGRRQFLLDMAILGDALKEVTGAYRINYEILGNSDQTLHAHVFPRYADEPQFLRSGPVWSFWKEVKLPPDVGLIKQIASSIKKRTGQ